MTFLWFSFKLDSLCLKSSVLSIKNFVAKEKDRIYVIEEENNPIEEEIKLILTKMGVIFKQRIPCNNLNGSKDKVQNLIDCMIALSDEEGIWKIDSDTLILDDQWRQIFKDYNFVGPQSLQFPNSAIGITYIAKKESLMKINLNNCNYSFRGWPEDTTISEQIYLTGDRVKFIPFNKDLGWCGWSYKLTATAASYKPFNIISFGNRFSIPGDNAEQRRIAGETMEQILRERIYDAKDSTY